MKKSFFFFISMLIVLAGCGELESIDQSFDEAEPCDKALRTIIPLFTTDDISPCAEIMTINFKEESFSEDYGRFLKYDIIHSTGFQYLEYLEVSEFTTCSDANQQYDLLNAAGGGTSSVTPSNISNIYNEAHLIYNLDGDENVVELVGRIENIVIRLAVEPFDCSLERESSIELFNNVGARASS